MVKITSDEKVLSGKIKEINRCLSDYGFFIEEYKYSLRIVTLSNDNSILDPYRTFFRKYGGNYKLYDDTKRGFNFTKSTKLCGINAAWCFAKANADIEIATDMLNQAGVFSKDVICRLVVAHIQCIVIELP